MGLVKVSLLNNGRLRWFGNAECKDDADWEKKMEPDRRDSRGRLSDCDEQDTNSFAVLRGRTSYKPRQQSANRGYLENRH